MKSRGEAENEANNAAQAAKEVASAAAEKIDFSKVVIEPMFEVFAEFDTFAGLFYKNDINLLEGENGQTDNHAVYVNVRRRKNKYRLDGCAGF